MSLNLLVIPLLFSSLSHAGVFQIPRFVDPDQYSLGIETEIILDDDASIGGMLKVTRGWSDLLNTTWSIGTGTSPWNFRTGGTMTFDFFPDLPEQPGIGLANEMIFRRFQGTSMLDLRAVPYIHKSFQVTKDGDEVEPFFSLPFGYCFREGKNHLIWEAVIGSHYRLSENFAFSTEVGFNLHKSETYVSTGLVSYF